jgi:hypothetical protein
MQRQTIKFLKISVFAGLAALPVQADLVRNPTHVGTSIDIGQIVAGTIWDEAGGNTAVGRADGQVITRTGVYLTESGVYNQRLTISLTIGGLFWFALPEKESPESRRVLFGPGVGQAQGTYAFGADPAKPAAVLDFGLFPHKYSDAVNLGEYLYRSGTYPGYLISGGWSYMNSAAYLAQGVRLSVPMLNGALKHDFTLFMERDIEPAHDISPGYSLTYVPIPFLTVGAGVVWSHGLPLRDASVLTPKRDKDGNLITRNIYSKTTGRPISGDTTGQGSGTPSSPCAAQVAADSANLSDCGFYTFKGFKTMARAALDFGSLLGVEGIGPGDFKLYTEVALLGVKDYPGYYDDKMERMPIMVGLNVPTFGVLNRLAFEGEYRKTRFANNIGSTFADELPLPVGQGASFPVDAESKTYWKWTVYANRTITQGVSIYAQAANDHLRHFDKQATPSFQPATIRNKDWYYVVRLEFGI